MRVWILVACLGLMMMPAATAEPLVVSENGREGILPAQTPATFHVVHMEDGLPAFHRDTHVRVLHEGRTLYETTPASGHEYDGIHTFTVTFPGPGAYEVQALEGGQVVDAVRGTVTPTQHARVHSVAALETGESARSATLRLDPITDTNMHTESLLRVYDDAGTRLRVELHDHAEGTTAQLYDANANVAVTRTLYQAGYGPTFAPVHFEMEGITTPINQQTFIAPALHAARNARTVSEGTDMVLVATYDPFTVVGPGTLSTIGILAMTPDGALLPHTNFEATLTGPEGFLFSTAHGHEHDGIWEVTSRNDAFGTYALRVNAQNGDAEASVEAKWTVAAPTDSHMGAYTVQVDAAESVAAGNPTWINTTIQNAAGPFAHGEVLLTIRDADGVEVLMTKLHTHANGVFPLQAALPAPGTYSIEVEPFSLSGSTAQFVGDLRVEVHATEELDAMGNAIAGDLQSYPAAKLLQGYLSFALFGLVFLVSAIVIVVRMRKRAAGAP